MGESQRTKKFPSRVLITSIRSAAGRVFHLTARRTRMRQGNFRVVDQTKRLLAKVLIKRHGLMDREARIQSIHQMNRQMNFEFYAGHGFCYFLYTCVGTLEEFRCTCDCNGPMQFLTC